MTFDVRDIHRPLDVFSRDDVYLGTVLTVAAGDPGPSHNLPNNRPSSPATEQASRVSGELLGPMPTAPLGNPGPRNQGADAGYRADDDGALSLGNGAIVVGCWWGLLGRRTVPLDQVLGLSLERVTLKLTAKQFKALL